MMNVKQMALSGSVAALMLAFSGMAASAQTMLVQPPEDLMMAQVQDMEPPAEATQAQEMLQQRERTRTRAKVQNFNLGSSQAAGEMTRSRTQQRATEMEEHAYGQAASAGNHGEAAGMGGGAGAGGGAGGGMGGGAGGGMGR